MPSKQKVSRPCTEKPSAGSKNLSAQIKGLEAENLVVEDLKNKKCQILGQRIKTPFAEVDILFRSSKGQLVLLEVKTLSKWHWLETRLTAKQTQRLLRAALYFQSEKKEFVQVCAAFVIKEKIYYLSLE